MVGQEEIFRKGPWTEQEDRQLVFYVNLFGDRRWDSIAKVSGLKVAGDNNERAGKSCRLRWVNYLHPGLKRGKMTPHEEQLVLQLQSKWGNRWSRIARKLPGRTDNEIKNYWRTHMRKRAQERKQGMSPPPSSSISNCSSSLSSNNARGNPMPIVETKGPNFYDTGGFLAPSLSMISKSSSSSSINPPVDTITMETKERSFYDTGGVEALGKKDEREEDQEGEIKVYPMDDIWKDIGFSEESLNLNYSNCPAMATSPVWNYNYCPDLPWMMEGDESKLFPTMNTDNFFSGNDLASSNFTG